MIGARRNKSQAFTANVTKFPIEHNPTRMVQSLLQFLFYNSLLSVIYLFSLPIPWKLWVIGYGFRWEDVQYKKAGRDKLKEARLRVIEGRLKDPVG